MIYTGTSFDFFFKHCFAIVLTHTITVHTCLSTSWHWPTGGQIAVAKKPVQKLMFMNKWLYGYWNNCTCYLHLPWSYIFLPFGSVASYRYRKWWPVAKLLTCTLTGVLKERGILVVHCQDILYLSTKHCEYCLSFLLQKIRLSVDCFHAIINQCIKQNKPVLFVTKFLPQKSRSKAKVPHHTKYEQIYINFIFYFIS